MYALPLPTLCATLTLAAVLLAAPNAQAQVCEGDVQLPTQGAVDSFACSEVTGGLFIYGGGINNLDGLNELVSVEEALSVSFTSLVTLDGLSSLQYVGWGLRLEENASLEDISGLGSLTSIGSLEVVQNDALLNIDGLDGITSLPGVTSIRNNDVLSDTNGLSGLTSAGEIWIQDNAALEHVDGLVNLTSVSWKFVIAGNHALTNVDGLAGLASVGWGLDLSYNYALTDCAVGLASYIENGGAITIDNNGQGCNSICEVMGTCPVAAGDEAASLITQIEPVHPNPSRGPIEITYTLAAPAPVRLRVYDALGRLIAVLEDASLSAGKHTRVWPATALPAGVYLLRLETGAVSETQRIVLTR